MSLTRVFLFSVEVLERVQGQEEENENRYKNKTNGWWKDLKTKGSRSIHNTYTHLGQVSEPIPIRRTTSKERFDVLLETLHWVELQHKVFFLVISLDVWVHSTVTQLYREGFSMAYGDRKRKERGKYGSIPACL